MENRHTTKSIHLVVEVLHAIADAVGGAIAGRVAVDLNITNKPRTNIGTTACDHIRKKKKTISVVAIAKYMTLFNILSEA